MPMEGLKKRLSFRKKKKDKVPECSKPHQWQEDEKKVRDGSCSFQVRYLGCVEVFDSRGMQVCEEAVKTLKAQCKGKYQRAILYVSGDALRVVDEISKSMIVDQTIEKVSFCAPDRNHEKGFAYICRDGTTRRWLCHGFLAVKESRLWRSQKITGERLSHAVGCAFTICLESKQKRDKESTASVTVNFSPDRTTFERMGSFRQTTLTERLFDPQSAILAEPVPVKVVDNPFAVQRPHATSNMLVRQGSFRGFSKLQEASSPFKRTLSLRLNDLPSTLARQNAIEISPPTTGFNGNGVIHEMPSPEKEESISQMCQQLTRGLSALTDDPFASAPLQGSHSAAGVKQHSVPTFHAQPVSMYHQTQPVHETNPWASTTNPKHNISAVPKPGLFQVHASPTKNPFLSSTMSVSTAPGGQTGRAKFVQENRSHSMDTSSRSGWQTQSAQKHTLLEMAHHPNFQVNGGASSSWEPLAPDWTTSATETLPTAQSQHKHIDKKEDSFDPFDVAWAAKSSFLNKQDVQQTSDASNRFSVKTLTSYKMDL